MFKVKQSMVKDNLGIGIPSF